MFVIFVGSSRLSSDVLVYRNHKLTGKTKNLLLRGDEIVSRFQAMEIRTKRNICLLFNSKYHDLRLIKTG